MLFFEDKVACCKYTHKMSDPHYPGKNIKKRRIQFHFFPSVSYSYFCPKIQDILSRVDFQDSNEIIDIGCGTGSFLGLIQSILKNGQSFVGVDLSHEMIKIAHAKHPEIDFIVADSDNLPLKEGYFDRILSVTHLQNLPEPKQTLEEMSRISAEKAIFAISILRKTWTKEKLKEIIEKSNLKIDSDWIADVEDIGVVCKKSS